VAHDCWWLPPSALALTGVPEFEALPPDVRRRVSRAEYVHLVEAGLWLESMFMARLASIAHAVDDAERRVRCLEELREEAGHSLLFVELLERAGLGFAPRRAVMRAVELLGALAPSRSALFWALVVVGEELPDRLNRRLARGVEEVTMSAVVYRIAQMHMRDEAAHAAFARSQCEQASERCPFALRMLLAPAVSIAIDLYARYVYFPPGEIYARAGLADPGRWRARALANPLRHAHVAEMMRPTLAFLRRCGWPVRGRYAVG
jgi:hypothetical protein